MTTFPPRAACSRKQNRKCSTWTSRSSRWRKTSMRRSPRARRSWTNGIDSSRFAFIHFRIQHFKHHCLAQCHVYKWEWILQPRACCVHAGPTVNIAVMSRSLYIDWHASISVRYVDCTVIKNTKFNLIFADSDRPIKCLDPDFPSISSLSVFCESEMCVPSLLVLR